MRSPGAGSPRCRRSGRPRRARPRALGGGEVAGGRWLVAAQDGQVEEDDERLAGDDVDTTSADADGSWSVGVEIGVEAQRLDVAGTVLADLGDAQELGA